MEVSLGAKSGLILGLYPSRQQGAMATNNAFSRETDLTGVWSGAYWYGGSGMPTPFTAHIIETAGSLTGTTLEPATFGLPGLAELSADITGAHGAQNVRFTKVYHSAQGVHRDPISYAGTVDAKLTSIEGDWRLPSGFSGRFVLVRASRGVKAKRAKKSATLELKR
jgi:hypothetical protein